MAGRGPSGNNTRETGNGERPPAHESPSTAVQCPGLRRRSRPPYRASVEPVGGRPHGRHGAAAAGRAYPPRTDTVAGRVRWPWRTHHPRSPGPNPRRIPPTIATGFGPCRWMRSSAACSPAWLKTTIFESARSPLRRPEPNRYRAGAYSPSKARRFAICSRPAARRDSGSLGACVPSQTRSSFGSSSRNRLGSQSMSSPQRRRFSA